MFKPPPTALPDTHAQFLESALERLAEDQRLIGAAIAGSALSGETDRFSDIDLVVGVDPGEFVEVMAEREEIAARLGPLLGGFTGEHVGEPRLLVCLYGPPLLHVDLKFVSAEGLADRVEEPAILWSRDNRFSDALSKGEASYPQPDLEWLEDRFWIWVHYTAGKIGRGELFEALDALTFLRGRVLGPLVLLDAGAQPNGVRRLETRAPAWVGELDQTVALRERESCLDALEATVECYLRLRSIHRSDSCEPRRQLERAARGYIAEVRALGDDRGRS